MMQDVLASAWGRLFRHWEHVHADERGYPASPGGRRRNQAHGLRALGKSLGILATCVKEAPGVRQPRHKARQATSRQPIGSSTGSGECRVEH